MINRAIFQTIDINEAAEGLKPSVLAWAIADKAKDEALEDLLDAKKSLEIFDFHSRELNNALSAMSQHFDAESSQRVLESIEENFSKLTLEENAIQAQAALDKSTKDFQKVEEHNLFHIRTHCFALTYHAFDNYWKTMDEFFDFIDDKVNTFNKESGSDIIEVSGVDDKEAPTVYFAFSASYKKEAELFMLNLVRDVRVDYEQNYIAELPDVLDNIKGKDTDESIKGKYLKAYTDEESTKHPFTLSDSSGMNLFYTYSRPSLSLLSLDEVKDSIKDHYGTPDNGDLLDYQVMKPHFVIDKSADPTLFEEVKNWREKAFDSVVNGFRIEKSLEGYDQIARMTADSLIDNNPHLVSKAEVVINEALGGKHKKDSSLEP